MNTVLLFLALLQAAPTVMVDNRSWADQRVYYETTTGRVRRLGEVSSLSRRCFSLPKDADRGRLWTRPLGGNDAAITEFFNADAYQGFVFTIPLLTTTADVVPARRCK